LKNSKKFRNAPFHFIETWWYTVFFHICKNCLKTIFIVVIDVPFVLNIKIVLVECLHGRITLGTGSDPQASVCKNETKKKIRDEI
jgi:hypothetical protein